MFRILLFTQNKNNQCVDLAFQKAMITSLQKFSEDVDETGGLAHIAKLGELVDASGGTENINSNLVLFKEVTQLSGGPVGFADAMRGEAVNHISFLHIEPARMSRRLSCPAITLPCALLTEQCSATYLMYITQGQRFVAHPQICQVHFCVQSHQNRHFCETAHKQVCGLINALQVIISCES
jgi:hypothetical protein